MKFFVYTVIVLFVIPFQITVIHSFPIGGRVPDVILVIVFLTGLWRGQIEATALGLVLGFLQDICIYGENTHLLKSSGSM